MANPERQAAGHQGRRKRPRLVRLMDLTTQHTMLDLARQFEFPRVLDMLEEWGPVTNTNAQAKKHDGVPRWSVLHQAAKAFLVRNL